MEYAETDYYSRHPQNINLNHFLYDYIEFLISKSQIAEGSHPIPNFLSGQFLNNSSPNFTECMCIITFLSLKNHTKEQTPRRIAEREGAILEFENNGLVFSKEVKESKWDEEDKRILLVNRYYPTKAIDSTQKQIEIKEFLVGIRYTCEIIVTNISGREITAQLLTQIPDGAIPLGITNFRKSVSITISSFSTLSFTQNFYFPSTGEFTHFPPSISLQNIVIAKSKIGTLNVVKERSILSKNNFRDILASGDLKILYAFLKKANLFDQELEVCLGDLQFLLRDKEIWAQVRHILVKRNIFQLDIWKYAFLHQNEEAIREYLEGNKALTGNSGLSGGNPLKSQLLCITAESLNLKYLDYYPLISARIHETQTHQSSILNQEFRFTYEKYIKYLVWKGFMNHSEKMILVVYLLLQERILEAIYIFEKLESEIRESEYILKENELEMQFDYLRAFIDTYKGGPEYKIAKEITKRYINCTISHWRIIFVQIYNLLIEAEGGEDIIDIGAKDIRGIGDTIQDKETERRIAMATAENTEPSLDANITGEVITLKHKNIYTLGVKYYIIDLEIIFSRNPFMSLNIPKYVSYLLPHVEESVSLLPERESTEIAITKTLLNKNMLIEITGQEIQRFLMYYSNQMSCDIQETLGVIKIMGVDGKLLQRTYVKVFARKGNGEVGFYKDGYTDIRGKFDYATLNAQMLKNVHKFSILIMHLQFGTYIIYI